MCQKSIDRKTLEHTGKSIYNVKTIEINLKMIIGYVTYVQPVNFCSLTIIIWIDQVLVL